MIKNQLEKTLSWANFQQAYLSLAEQFDQGSLTARYSGMDGLRLGQIDYQAKAIIKEVTQDTIDCRPITAARLVTLKKRDGSERQVYILTTRDRLRARAIFQVLEPLCESAYSQYLFSYRSQYPSYLAAKSVARRYHRNYGQDYCLTVDLKSYSDYLDHDILRQKLLAIGVEVDFMKIIEPFFNILLSGKTKAKQQTCGLPQGTPLTALMANIYLNDVDKLIGPQVSLYRRVGDDLIILDKNKLRVERVFDQLQQEIKNLKLILHRNKLFLGKSNQTFKYLGYEFKDNHLNLDKKFILELTASWRKILRPSSGNLTRKIQRLQTLSYYSTNSFQLQFEDLFKQHSLLDNDQQIKKLSNQFYTYVTGFLFGKISPRNRKLTAKILSEKPIPSLYEYYLAICRGRKHFVS